MREPALSNFDPSISLRDIDLKARNSVGMLRWDRSVRVAGKHFANDRRDHIFEIVRAQARAAGAYPPQVDLMWFSNMVAIDSVTAIREPGTAKSNVRRQLN
jgi:hypothetical protein